MSWNQALVAPAAGAFDRLHAGRTRWNWSHPVAFADRRRKRQGIDMRELLYRLLKHPGHGHHFVESRSHPGMVTCKTCRFRKWSGR